VASVAEMQEREAAEEESDRSSRASTDEETRKARAEMKKRGSREVFAHEDNLSAFQAHFADPSERKEAELHYGHDQHYRAAFAHEMGPIGQVKGDFVGVGERRNVEEHYAHDQHDRSAFAYDDLISVRNDFVDPENRAEVEKHYWHNQQDRGAFAHEAASNLRQAEFVSADARKEVTENYFHDQHDRESFQYQLEQTPAAEGEFVSTKERGKSEADYWHDQHDRSGFQRDMTGALSRADFVPSSERHATEEHYQHSLIDRESFQHQMIEETLEEAEFVSSKKRKDAEEHYAHNQHDREAFQHESTASVAAVKGTFASSDQRGRVEEDHAHNQHGREAFQHESTASVAAVKGTFASSDQRGRVEEDHAHNQHDREAFQHESTASVAAVKGTFASSDERGRVEEDHAHNQHDREGFQHEEFAAAVAAVNMAVEDISVVEQRHDASRVGNSEQEVDVASMRENVRDNVAPEMLYIRRSMQLIEEDSPSLEKSHATLLKTLVEHSLDDEKTKKWKQAALDEVLCQLDDVGMSRDGLKKRHIDLMHDICMNTSCEEDKSFIEEKVRNSHIALLSATVSKRKSERRSSTVHVGGQVRGGQAVASSGVGKSFVAKSFEGPSFSDEEIPKIRDEDTWAHSIYVGEMSGTADKNTFLKLSAAKSQAASKYGTMGVVKPVEEASSGSSGMLLEPHESISPILTKEPVAPSSADSGPETSMRTHALPKQRGGKTSTPAAQEETAAQEKPRARKQNVSAKNRRKKPEEKVTSARNISSKKPAKSRVAEVVAERTAADSVSETFTEGSAVFSETSSSGVEDRAQQVFLRGQIDALSSAIQEISGAIHEISQADSTKTASTKTHAMDLLLSEVDDLLSAQLLGRQQKKKGVAHTVVETEVKKQSNAISAQASPKEFRKNNSMGPADKQQVATIRPGPGHPPGPPEAGPASHRSSSGSRRHLMVGSPTANSPLEQPRSVSTSPALERRPGYGIGMGTMSNTPALQEPSGPIRRGDRPFSALSLSATAGMKTGLTEIQVKTSPEHAAAVYVEKELVENSPGGNISMLLPGGSAMLIEPLRNRGPEDPHPEDQVGARVFGAAVGPVNALQEPFPAERMRLLGQMQMQLDSVKKHMPDVGARKIAPSSASLTEHAVSVLREEPPHYARRHTVTKHKPLIGDGAQPNLGVHHAIHHQQKGSPKHSPPASGPMGKVGESMGKGTGEGHIRPPPANQPSSFAPSQPPLLFYADRDILADSHEESSESSSNFGGSYRSNRRNAPYYPFGFVKSNSPGASKESSKDSSIQPAGRVFQPKTVLHSEESEKAVLQSITGSVVHPRQTEGKNLNPKTAIVSLSRKGMNVLGKESDVEPLDACRENTDAPVSEQLVQSMKASMRKFSDMFEDFKSKVDGSSQDEGKGDLCLVVDSQSYIFLYCTDVSRSPRDFVVRGIKSSEKARRAGLFSMKAEYKKWSRLRSLEEQITHSPDKYVRDDEVLRLAPFPKFLAENTKVEKKTKQASFARDKNSTSELLRRKRPRLYEARKKKWKHMRRSSSEKSYDRNLWVVHQNAQTVRDFESLDHLNTGNGFQRRGSDWYSMLDRTSATKHKAKMRAASSPKVLCFSELWLFSILSTLIIRSRQ